MRQSVLNVLQSHFTRDEKGVLTKDDSPDKTRPGLQTIRSRFARLVSFFSLTEDEQKDAGVFWGHQRYK
jgi:hypothetical protein